jgi:hypothetical protein
VPRRQTRTDTDELHAVVRVLESGPGVSCRTGLAIERSLVVRCRSSRTDFGYPPRCARERARKNGTGQTRTTNFTLVHRLATTTMPGNSGAWRRGAVLHG